MSLQAIIEDGETSEMVKRIQERARQLAHSSQFVGWRAVAFELRFEAGYTDGLDWIQSPAAQEEIDRLCNEARNRTNRRVA